jgi:hypothetical protein
VVAVAAAEAGLFVAGSFDRAGNDRAAGLAHWDARPSSVPGEEAVTGGREELLCWPNPFTSRVTIKWSTQSSVHHRLQAVGDARCTITIHDLLGRRVAVLFDGEGDAVPHMLEWNAEGMAAGIYICRLSHDGIVSTCKLMLVR